MNKLIDRILDILSNRTKVNEQLQILEKEQRQAKSSLDNLIKNAEQGLVGQSINNRVKELEEQIATLDQAIFTERSKIDTTLNREQLQKHYNDAIKRNVKEIVGLLIKQIRVYNDRINIVINTPLKKSPDDDQGSFYSTNFTNIALDNKGPTQENINTQYYSNRITDFFNHNYSTPISVQYHKNFTIKECPYIIIKALQFVTISFSLHSLSHFSYKINTEKLHFSNNL